MKKEKRKEWFLDRYCGQQFAALVEDGELAEFEAERENRSVTIGNIYKGKITTILAGMNAAFVQCGLSRNCYLALDEMYANRNKYDVAEEGKSTETLDLQVGDEVIVQVTQVERGTKGAKVSTHLSFVGKRIIYLPNTGFLGISRKITEEKKRERLLKVASKLRAQEEEGFIIRTQASVATQKQLKAEAKYLKNLCQEMYSRSKTAPVGTLLYEDEDLPMRVMRDSFGNEISAFHVGDRELYEKLLHLVRLRGDLPERKLVLYNGERSMFNEYGITPLLYDLANPVVQLKSGGYLVMERTEAMTVVDVNSGRYTGGDSLEETVFSVNLEAAKEIARQVRLRNIGGIVVVDFIDMLNESHREAVTEELRKHLEEDTAKFNLLPMSELCITQFTRKRVGCEVLSFLVKTCPHCIGRGHVHEDTFVVAQIRAHIMDRFADGATSAIVECNDGIMRKILREGMLSQEAKNRWQDKRVYFVPHKTYHETQFSVRGERGNVLQLCDNAELLY